MNLPGLNGTHRGFESEFDRDYGNTHVRKLRKIYGSTFAPNARDDDEVRQVLRKLDEPSMALLVHDHERDRLEAMIAAARRSCGGGS